MRRILNMVGRSFRSAWAVTRPVPLLTPAEFAVETESWRIRSGLDS